MLKAVLALVLLTASTAAAQTPKRKTIKPPVLQNRAEIVVERQRIANTLLERGDSLLILVYAFVNEKGETRQPEVKEPSGNPKADTAAMLLVKKMRWQPSPDARRGVMMTIPVKLVRK